MAASSRRQVPTLIGLLLLLAAVVWWQFGGSSPTGARPAGGQRPPTAVRPTDSTVVETPEAILSRGVGLDRLAEDRPAPEEGRRDPFRSGPTAGAGSSSGVAGPAPPPVTTPAAPPEPIGPVGPPPPPPISVKFIGVVSRRDVGKVAILSDGKNVYYGRQGEIVDGRWRIVSIGEESLQIEYVDGRGRQTVRLTG